MRYPKPEDRYSCEVLCENFMEIEERLSNVDIGYKTLVDVTLDDSNSGSNTYYFELPDEFKNVTEFVTHIEIPIIENVNNVYMNGYITDDNSTYYAQCILYNSGVMVSGTGSNYTITSLSKFILEGEKIFSICSRGDSYVGANSANANCYTIIDSSYKERWDVEKPYLKIGVDGVVLPTGTRIIMEGR